MRILQNRKGLFASTFLSGAAVTTLLALASPAAAQPAAQPPQEEVPVVTTDSGSTEVGSLVVTGTRIRRTDIESAAPVAVITAQDIVDQGFVQVGQALNENTSVTPSAPQSAGSGGSSGSGRQFPSIFGLGAGRTLTLVNGRRFVTTASGGESIVDTNVIPTGLVRRIEVVQGGGAAVYGSDAIAGVVNYILRDEFEGVELDAQYGVTSENDYPTTSLRGTFGKNFLDGRGNLALAVEYSKTGVLYNEDREATNRARVTVTNPLNTGPADGIPSVTPIFDARFWSFNYNGLLFTPAPAPVSTFIFRVAGAPQQFSADGRTLVPFDTGTLHGVPFASGGDGFSYRDQGALFTGVERFNANLLGRFDVNDHLKVTGEFLHANTTGRDPLGNFATNTVLNSAATGAGAISISRQNPFLTPEVRALLGPGGPPLFLSKAWTDLLPTRESLSTTETTRGLIGLEGDFSRWGREFYYTASFSRGEVDGTGVSWGVWNARFNNAINAVSSGTSIVCAINANASLTDDDPNCAPINPFGAGNVSDAARNYVSVRTDGAFHNRQDDFLATLGGDLAQIPGGMVAFSLAYEHREESTDFSPSQAAILGLTGSGAVSVPTSGAYDTNEYSLELLVPIFGEDFTLPGVRALELSGAYRIVENSVAGNEDVWSSGLRWEIVESLALRASRSRNFRAPTLDALYAPVSTRLGTIGLDPCDADRINGGPAPAIRLANCTALFTANPTYGGTGTVAQRLAAFQSSSENFASTLITTGGNLNLENEISDTLTYGFIFQPTFIPGLTVVVDRIDVELTNGLSGFTPANFMATCFDTAPQPLDACSTFTRDAAGQVITAQAKSFNAGLLNFEGEVYNVNYRFPLERLFSGREWGELDLGVEATHTTLRDTSVTGTDYTRTDDTVGVPEWVTRIDVRWTRGPLRIAYSLNHVPEEPISRFDTIESNPNPVIGSNTRHNINASYDFGNFVLRGGVRNVTNEPPSFPSLFYGGGILGRQYFIGIRATY